MSVREGLEFETALESDTAPLWGLVEAMLAVDVDAVHVLRDPTRGGLGVTLNEIAHASKVGIALDERAIPVKPAVSSACKMLGLDPLYVANEGKLIAIVAPDKAEVLLAISRALSLTLSRKSNVGGAGLIQMIRAHTGGCRGFHTALAESPVSVYNATAVASGLEHCLPAVARAGKQDWR